MNLGNPSPKNGWKNEIHIDLYNQWKEINKQENVFNKYYYASRSQSHKMLITTIVNRTAKTLRL